MPTRLFSPRRATQPSTDRVAEPVAPMRKGREAAALLLVTLAVFLCLALASYRMDPADPTRHGADWVGPVGAAIASVLAGAFGLAAWVAPVELALLSGPLFRRRPNRATALRGAGDLALLIVGAALLEVAFPNANVFGKAPVGGQVGLLFGELMRAMFSTVGSFLIGMAIVGLILIGRSTFSFIQLAEGALKLGRRAGAQLRVGSVRLGGVWREARDITRARREEAKSRPIEAIENRATDDVILAHLATADAGGTLTLDETGTPPIALSAKLKQGLRVDADALIDGTERLFGQGAANLGNLPVTEPNDVPPDSDGPPASVGALEAALTESDRAPETDHAEAGADRVETTEEGDNEPAAEAVDQAAEAAHEEVAELAPPPRKKRERKKKAAAKAELGPTIVDTSDALKVERGAVKRSQADDFELPSTEILDRPPPQVKEVSRDKILELAALLEKTLADHKVICKVEEIQPGPTVTTYECAPEPGTRVRRVAGLSDDLALGLSRKVRIIAPIPGKSRIGFELPNDERVPVNLRELVEDKRFGSLAEKAPLPIVFGRDIVGAPFYGDLSTMPHMIVAGATGAGKSVGLNVMLSSMLFHRSPEQLRLLMIDPKVVELAPYDGIPHMLLPVVTDMKQAVTALKWAVDEMERRYKLFAGAGTKNIKTYNNWVEKVRCGDIEPPKAKTVEGVLPDGTVEDVPAAKTGTDGEDLPDRLPFIVIVVDEFADLMMQQGKEVEAAVARLAQKARAAGMHVVLATQRPSVDVITGMIKANFPTRVAFRVAQKVDSRTILDEQGAELLLGKGDMLVKLNGSNETTRVQCPFISEEEVDRLTEHLRSQGTPEYNEEILKADEEKDDDLPEEKVDARFDEAVQIVADTQRCSTSWLQRKMTVGYNRAAKMVEMMEKRGMVGPPNGSRDREIFMSPQ